MAKIAYATSLLNQGNIASLASIEILTSNDTLHDYVDYKNRISLFNEYSYTLLINQSKVIDDATKFFNSTKDSLNQSVVFYNKAMQVKD